MNTPCNFTEKDITRAIAESFFKSFNDCIESDCIIVGGGPSGLIAARDLALAGKKIVIIERNNYLGGGFWSGGYLMNKITIKEPAQEIFEELKIPFTEYKQGLYVADAPLACSTLISETAKAGAKILNMTSFDDVVLRDKKISGVVINWTAISHLPRSIAALDPIALESKIIIDATGHDAKVCGRLAEQGIIKMKGMGTMWVEESEKVIVEYTDEIYPGLVICGMAVSTVFGLPRMGPIFSSMLLSGKKAAGIILDKVTKDEIRDTKDENIKSSIV
ncbi:MAG: sulfide-dependent adenosine diphosphate thiazole synthase [Candidatus Omnitrophota bacterium]|nr:sulfide-dependent adenosine diphosphate thiazole synthase [Candidatus Omnitrophota bacterium]